MISVLVADESDTILKAVQVAFTGHDVAVRHARTRVEVETLLTVGQPTDLVVLSASLARSRSPDDRLGALLEISPQTAFVVLIGTYDALSEDELQAAGYLHCMHKRLFQPSAMLAVAGDLLGSRFFPRGNAAPAAAKGKSQEAARPTPPRAGSAIPFPPAGPGSGLALDLDIDGDLDTSSLARPETNPWTSGRKGKPPPRPPEGGPGARTTEAPDLDQSIEVAVRAYCEKHFREIARDVITKELKRLAAERARLSPE